MYSKVLESTEKKHITKLKPPEGGAGAVTFNTHPSGTT